MGKSFILFLGLIVLISGCVQPPTGKVVSQPQEPLQPNLTTAQQVSQNITQPVISNITQQPVPQTQPTEAIKTNIIQQIVAQNFSCEGTVGCYYGNVTRIIDGDTIEVDNIRIRLVLVDAPEPSYVGGFEATNFIHQNCPVGLQVLLDQDDWQLYDNYDRMLAVVWCHGKRINEEIIAQGYADIYYQFCSKSEFGDDNWAVRLGCTQQVYEPTTNKTATPTPTQTATIPTSAETQQNCDPAYPTVCIPPPPPDLDCSEISYKRFKVLPPDPHRFDGDKDGIGCER